MAATWTKIDAISVRSTQAATEAAPTTTDDSEGMPIANVMAITIWLDAGAGQTITSDAGQADLYIYDGGAWGIAGAAPLSVPPHSAGLQRVSLGTITIENQRGRIAPICNGVTVSGSSATLDVLATVDRRGIAKAA